MATDEVINPTHGLPFSKAGAWDLVASRLENGHPVEVVELHKPKRKPGYVMTIKLDGSSPPVYVKLELGSGKIVGRSFHYSIPE